MTDQITRIATASILCLLAAVLAMTADASSSRNKVEAEQATLDQACTDAREAILSVDRRALIEECVREKFPRSDRAGCERFYSDYGAAAGGRAPLYMDLPECVTAHEFRQNRSR